MSGQNPQHPSDQDSGAKNHTGQREGSPGVKTKRKVRQWIWLAAIATIIAFLAQVVGAFDNKLLIPSLVLVMLACVAWAYALWIQLTNNNASHMEANCKAGVIVLIGFVIVASLFWWHCRRPTSLPPVISPNRIQLGDGNRSRESLIDIFNPNDFLLYLTTILIATIRTSDDQTISFPKENVPESERVMSTEGSMDELRLEYNNRATNWHFVIFMKMSPKAHRPLRIRGSAGNPNWSELSIIDYRKEYSLSHDGANDTRWDAPPSDSKVWKYMPSWLPRTNLSIKIIHSP